MPFSKRSAPVLFIFDNVRLTIITKRNNRPRYQLAAVISIT